MRRTAGVPAARMRSSRPQRFELDDRAAHQRVGRQRVAAFPATVHDDDVEARPGQEHRRRGARSAGTDDDDVGVGACLHHRPHVLRTIGRQAERQTAGVDQRELGVERMELGRPHVAVGTLDR